MKKNLYYRTVFRRRNFLQETFFSLFSSIAPLSRLLIENLIRKNMGERYFSYFLSIVTIIAMVLTPIITCKLFFLFGGYGEPDFETLFLHYTTWYIYTWFLFRATMTRNQEVKREPSVFDFQRFSLSTGYVIPFYLQFIPTQLSKNPRQQQIFGEALPFLLLGLMLMIAQQPLGAILATSAIIYMISYAFAYYQGDNFVMDHIDEMILNSEMESSFVGDADPSQNKGVKFYMRKPNGEALRRAVGETFIEETSGPKTATLMQ